MTRTGRAVTGRIVALMLLALGVWGYWRHAYRVPPTAPEAKNSTETESVSGFELPEGFGLSIFADDVPGARVMAFDPKGRLVVSETDAGKIVALADTDGDGRADERTTLADGLAKPSGLAFDCREACMLYVAEPGALSRYAYDAAGPSLGTREKLLDLKAQATDRHFTRSLLFLPAPNDDTLLVSVGSSCNVCHESGDYASIFSYDVKTGKKATYATGLRNATFLALDPVHGKVFASEMGRDNLGDDLPPDEIDVIENENPSTGLGVKNFGWPICYGKNIHDDAFDKNTYIRNPCMAPFETPSFVDLPAHSAPLGLGFIPEEGWPEGYWYDLLVAYHGSWNRSTPTGYKIARLKLDAQGNYEGTEDFITGWLTAAGAKTGRPVDIKVLSGGTAFISDDSRGVIYRLSRTAE